MSQFVSELIPIAFMYLFCFALAPFIAWALWMAFEGDREQPAETETVEPTVDAAAEQVTLPARSAPSAA